MLSTWNSIRHKELILRLQEVVKLPAKLAVIHCKGPQKGQEKEAQVNRKADQEAKWATREATHHCYLSLFPEETLTPGGTRYPERGFGHMGGSRLIRPK